MDSLLKQFIRHFEIINANTPVLLDEALRLRYQVYCRETGYEASDKYPDGIEYDQFDLFSVHSVIRHRHTRRPAANVRLILPRSNHSDFHFPLQDIVGTEEIEKVSGFTKDNRHEFAEISRFCVSRDFKCQFHTDGTIADDFQLEPDVAVTVPEQIEKIEGTYVAPRARDHGMLLPHITIALFAAIFKMSAEEGIRHWLAIMEPSLLRFLNRYGISFTPIGKPVDHRGLRQPCYASADEIALGIWQKRPSIWRFVTDNGNVWPLAEPIQAAKLKKVRRRKKLAN